MTALADPPRLDALHATGLVDAPADEVLDGVARLAARLLDAPIGLVSLVGADAMHLPGAHGLPGRWASSRRVALSHSLCRHVVERDAPLLVRDARRDELVRDSPVVADLALGAYLGVPLRAPGGDVLGAVCALDVAPRDWSEDEVARLEDLRHAAEARLRLGATAGASRRSEAPADPADRREPLRAVVAAAPIVLFAFDARGVVTLSEGKGLELLGRVSGASVGHSIHDLYRDEPQLLAECRRALRGERLTVVTSLGARRYETTYEPVLDEAGAVETVIGVATDVTDRCRAEEEIAYLAYHDQLTELPNRACFHERLREALAAARRDGRALALLWIDLDGFKAVNDSLGHAGGDDLLRGVGARLRSAAGEGALLARHGGDEFLLLVDGAAGDVDAVAREAAERVLAALRPAWSIEGLEFFVGASIGIAVHPRDGEYAPELLRRADTALYAAKRAGRGCHAFARRDDAPGPARLTLAARLRRALDRDEFVLHYQPVFDVAADRPVAAEALVRWEDPERGLVAPGLFVPVAEEVGLISALGEWVLDAVCAQMRAWSQAGLQSRIAVNVAPQQLARPDFADRVLGIVGEHGIDPRWLMVEITESAAATDAVRTGAVLHRLHEAGLRLAIDDFGAGYSSLSRLRELPVDALKIDCAFVRGVPDDPSAGAVVTAILALAGALGMVAVAEGVETAEQYAFVAASGCPYAQGFHLSRPGPPEAFAELLAAAPARRAA